MGCVIALFEEKKKREKEFCWTEQSLIITVATFNLAVLKQATQRDLAAGLLKCFFFHKSVIDNMETI